MKAHRYRRASWIGALLVLAVIAIIGWKQFRGYPPKDREPGPEVGRSDLPPGAGSDPKAMGGKEVQALLAKLSAIREGGETVPEELKVQAQKFINSKKVPYKSRIQLALLALDEEWSAKHIEIIFRNEISKRPFETVQELFKLVPEGELQDKVADSIGQTASITAGDAPEAVAWLESLPASSREKAVSIISFRLRYANDLETLKSLEKSSGSEELKMSFGWSVAELEKQKGVKQ